MKHLLLTTIAAVVLVGCIPKKLQKTKAIPIQQAEPPTVKAPDISIHEAVATDYTEAVKQHLASGTDVNARNDGGYTPLHWVAVRDHKEIAELLIAAGADVNAKILIGKFKGETPLDFAKKTTADLLRKHGGKTGDWFKAGESIHIAASEGHIEAVKQHLEAGVNVNAKNQRGLTPLHAAAVNGHKEVTELLIDKSADVNAKTKRGDTPLDWAIHREHTETADLLRKHGGKTGEELKAAGK